MSRELKAFIKETVSIIIIAFILAMIIRTFVIEGYIIPSTSMLPTLQVNDRVMVNKFIYHFKEPQRGDILVFDPPAELSSEYPFIKRVIGLPGDKVEMRNKKVYINDKPVEEPYLGEPLNYDYGPITVPEDSLLVLGDNRNHSNDSHLWDSWLKRDRVIGKALLIYWPIKDVQLLERGIPGNDNGFVNISSVKKCKEL